GGAGGGPAFRIGDVSGREAPAVGLRCPRISSAGTEGVVSERPDRFFATQYLRQHAARLRIDRLMGHGTGGRQARLVGGRADRQDSDGLLFAGFFGGTAGLWTPTAFRCSPGDPPSYFPFFFLGCATWPGRPQ